MSSKKIFVSLSMAVLTIGVFMVVYAAQGQQADTTPPEIRLIGEATEEYLQGELYEERGAVVTDGVDGNISAYLEISGDIVDTPFAGKYRYQGYVEPYKMDGAWYKVSGPEGGLRFTDSHRVVPVAFQTNLPFNYGRLDINGATEYWFQYRTDADRIRGLIFKKKIGGRVLGTFETTYTVNSSWYFTADMTVRSGAVDTSLPGTYFIRYNATDKAGNAAQEVIRKVIVVDTGLTREQAYAVLRGEDPNTIPVAPAPATPQPTNQPSAQGVTQSEENQVNQIDDRLITRLAGRILLQVDRHGEAWYVDPVSRSKYYLQDGASAYTALRKFGLGITNRDLARIPVGIESRFVSTDTDNDSPPDKLEEALGTNFLSADTDGDGITDGAEVLTNKTSPLGAGVLQFDAALSNRLRGKIALQVESLGEAWYINPVDGKRYYLKDGDAAYQIMRFLSLGISTTDIRKIPVGNID